MIKLTGEEQLWISLRYFWGIRFMVMLWKLVQVPGGHSHPQGNGGFGKARVFSKNWFVGSCLNVAKLFKDDYSRVLGDMVKSQADSRLNK